MVRDCFLLHASSDSRLKVYYFREGGREVDFVVKFGGKLLGIEVKSGGSGKTGERIARFKERFPAAQTLLVGASGLPLEDFLEADVKELFREGCARPLRVIRVMSHYGTSPPPVDEEPEDEEPEKRKLGTFSGRRGKVDNMAGRENTG